MILAAHPATLRELLAPGYFANTTLVYCLLSIAITRFVMAWIRAS